MILSESALIREIVNRVGYSSSNYTLSVLSKVCFVRVLSRFCLCFDRISASRFMWGMIGYYRGVKALRVVRVRGSPRWTSGVRGKPRGTSGVRGTPRGTSKVKGTPRGTS